jgi:hypothetical protein
MLQENRLSGAADYRIVMGYWVVLGHHADRTGTTGQVVFHGQSHLAGSAESDVLAGYMVVLLAQSRKFRSRITRHFRRGLATWALRRILHRERSTSNCGGLLLKLGDRGIVIEGGNMARRGNP